MLYQLFPDAKFCVDPTRVVAAGCIKSDTTYDLRIHLDTGEHFTTAFPNEESVIIAHDKLMHLVNNTK